MIRLYMTSLLTSLHASFNCVTPHRVSADVIIRLFYPCWLKNILVIEKKCVNLQAITN